MVSSQAVPLFPSAYSVTSGFPITRTTKRMQAGQYPSPTNGAKFIFMVRRKRSLLKKISMASRPCEILVCLFSALQKISDFCYVADSAGNGSGLSTNHSPLFKRVAFGTVW
jgi:hypothetical protein